jgi:hypothetical protein
MLIVTNASTAREAREVVERAAQALQFAYAPPAAARFEKLWFVGGAQRRIDSRMENDELRIPARPQLWLWWGSVIVFPPLAALTFYGAWAGGGGSRVGVALMGLLFVALSALAVVVLVRVHGRPFHVVLASAHLEIPSLTRRGSIVVPLSSIERAVVHTFRVNGVAFSDLTVSYRANERRKSAVVAQQLIGREALDHLCEALSARGVPVG